MATKTLTFKIVTVGDKQADAALKKTSETATQTTQKVRDTASTFMSMAQGFSQIGAAASKMAEQSISAFASFDQAMANTVSILNVTTKQSGQMESMAKQMAATMPVSAEQVAQGYYTLASAGMEANRIMEVTPSIMKLATATAADFGTTAGAVTAVMDTFKDAAGSVNNITDVLMNTVKGFKTTLPELGESFKYSAGAAATAGVDFTALAAATGMIRQAGLGASQAGTGLSKMIGKMAKMTPEATEKMSQYGMEIIKNSDGTLDLISTMENFQAALSNTQPLEKLNALQTIFGEIAGKSAIALVENADKFGALSEQVSQGGSVQDAFSKQMEGAANQLKVLENRMELARMEFGEKMLPTTIALTKAKIKLYETLTDLPGPLGEIAAGTVAVVGELGGMASTILTLMPGLIALKSAHLGAAAAKVWHAITTGAMAVAHGISAAAVWLATAAQWALNAAMAANPIGLIVIAIVAMIAIIVLLVLWYQKATGWVKLLALALLVLLGPIGMAVAAVLAIIYVIKNWGKIVDWLKKAINVAIDGIVSAFQWLSDNIETIMTYIIIVALLPILLPIKLIVAIVKNWGEIMEWLGGVFVAFWEGIKAIPGLIVDGFWVMIDFFKELPGKVVGYFNDIVSFFTELPDKAKQWGIDMLQRFIDGILAIKDKVVKTIKGVADNIKNFLGFDILANDMWAQQSGADLIHHIRVGMVKGASQEMPAIRDASSSITNSVASTSTVNNFGSLGRRAGRYDAGSVIGEILEQESGFNLGRGAAGGVQGYATE